MGLEWARRVLTVTTTYTITAEAVNRRRARISVSRVDTDNRRKQQEEDLSIGADLAHIFGDERLRQFKITELVPDPTDPRVCFDGLELRVGQPYEFATSAGPRIAERATLTADTTYRVFNLVDRAARDTGLTRPTINRIFKGLAGDKKRRVLTNPEGFAGVFIATVRNALADHITDGLTFKLDDHIVQRDLDDLFPPEVSFPQKELVDADQRGLYDYVQVDSGEERTFVERLKNDPKVIFYFKFPPTFKVPLPKLIGNYNPDWGVARYDDTGKIVLQLIRETKGSEEIADLRFPAEQRKVLCAKKHFKALNVDYRAITGSTAAWWTPSPDAGIHDLLGE